MSLGILATKFAKLGIWSRIKPMKRRAIIYTENFEQIQPLAEFLVSDDWEILSAGETAAYLAAKNIPVTVEKSLLPSDRENDNYYRLLSQIEQTGNDYNRNSVENIGAIKLVCINLVPSFKPLSEFLEESSSENCINFKHISLIRCAAKNYNSTIVLTDAEDYQEAIIQLKTANVTKDFRLEMAGKALNLCSAYDSALSLSIIMQKPKIEFPKYFMVPYEKILRLNHGNNPHQNAYLYSENLYNSALDGMKKIQGLELDLPIVKNYFLAWNIVSLFLRIIKNPFEVESLDCSGYSYSTQFTPAAGSVFTIGIKNNNPIGASLGPNVSQSIAKTFACAPDIFDGATLGCSAVIDESAAISLSKSNLVCIIAPDFTKEARQILAENHSVRLIVASKVFSGFHEISSVDGGILVQTPDYELFRKWQVVTQKRPTQSQIDSMAFGTMVILAAKSDSAIVVNDFSAIGISTGQPSRKRSIMLALYGAEESLKNGLTSSDTNAEILVSDTSIPFDEKIVKAAELGVKAIIQTGGTSSDQALIDFCNEHEISMVFTGMRHLAF